MPTARLGIKWEDRYEQFDGLGENQLRDVARNESASKAYRLLAMEILLKKGYKAADHRELAMLKAELAPKIQIEEIEHESEIEEPLPIVEEFGPLKASVTTASMLGVQKIDSQEGETSVDA